MWMKISENWGLFGHAGILNKNGYSVRSLRLEGWRATITISLDDLSKWLKLCITTVGQN